MSAKVHLAGRHSPTKRRQGTRTALYLRVSTAEQKPDLQYDDLRGYAARAGLDVVRDYCDIAVSGRREGRPRLNALMVAARNREIDCVLVWKFDRFARNTRHLLTALEESRRIVTEIEALAISTDLSIRQIQARSQAKQAAGSSA